MKTKPRPRNKLTQSISFDPEKFWEFDRDAKCILKTGNRSLVFDVVIEIIRADPEKFFGVYADQIRKRASEQNQ